MRRITIFAFLIVALIGIGVSGRTIDSAAQDDAAGHPLVGAWMLDTDADNPGNSPTLAIFGADGTYMQTDNEGGSAGVGVWQQTGAQTADLTFHSLFDLGGEGAGMLTIRAAIEVAADGQSLTATYTIELTPADDSGSGQFGPGRVTGTRIVSEPMGTPVGSFEDLFGQFEEGGATPEASPAA